MLDPDQERSLKGAMYLVGARLAKQRRSPDDWSISLLFDIHRDIFGKLFPKQAGTQRQEDVSFRSHAIPAPGKIQYRLTDIVRDARAIVEQAYNIDDVEERIQTVIPKIAQVHAQCVVVQPFIDGNKRWARQVLSALLVDCGFWPGSRINASDRERYLDGIDKSIAGHHDQLAELILEGWLQLQQDFSSGTY